MKITYFMIMLYEKDSHLLLAYKSRNLCHKRAGLFILKHKLGFQIFHNFCGNKYWLYSNFCKSVEQTLEIFTTYKDDPLNEKTILTCKVNGISNQKPNSFHAFYRYLIREVNLKHLSWIVIIHREKLILS